MEYSELEQVLPLQVPKKKNTVVYVSSPAHLYPERVYYSPRNPLRMLSYSMIDVFRERSDEHHDVGGGVSFSWEIEVKKVEVNLPSLSIQPKKEEASKRGTDDDVTRMDHRGMHTSYRVPLSKIFSTWRMAGGEGRCLWGMQCRHGTIDLA